MWEAAEQRHCLNCCHHIKHKGIYTKFGPFRKSKFLISLCYFPVASPAKMKVVSDRSVLNILNYFSCRYILHKNLSVFNVRPCKFWHIAGAFAHYNSSLKSGWFVLCSCNLCGGFHHLFLCLQLALQPRTRRTKKLHFLPTSVFLKSFMACWEG